MPDGDDSESGHHHQGFIEGIEKPPCQKAEHNHQSRLHREKRTHVNDSLLIRKSLDQKEHAAPVDYINCIQQKKHRNRQLRYIGTNVRPGGEMFLFHYA